MASKNTLAFNIPFCGFAGTNFVNCFASVYMFLENIDIGGSDYACRQLEGKGCNSCGNCAAGGGTPISRQEKYFHLFDTMCGRSSLRCRFDGELTEMQKWIGETGPGSCDTDETIDFLFGFAGYEYRKATGGFQTEIAASINAGKPVIAKVKAGAWPFRVITGYDGNKLLCPSFINAQNPPKKAPKYDELEALYVIGEKTAPRYTLKDGLERIVKVMEYNRREKLWEGYCEKIAMHNPDGIDTVGTEEKKARLKRVARTMEYTWNSHNFAEVFRRYRDDGDASVYDGVGDMKLLRNPALKELWDQISGPLYGYTHDLCWAVVGLEETANWKGHVYRSGYFGEMVELVLVKLREHDEKVLEIIKRAIAILVEK
ncbi:MAG: hypothetical protein FWF60_07070 [Oscillospiraceae bacterium]|nr:hypothetical protein [Oscillospiraceae bacterium]